MTSRKPQANRLQLKLLAAVGGAAVVALAALSLTNEPARSSSIDLAGSGDAPTNTVYVQPTENAMTMGATATWTTPSSVLPTAKAVPPLGAG